MALIVEISIVACATLLLFFGTAFAVARLLRLAGIRAQLAAMAVRIVLAALLAIALAFSEAEHRVALVFTVGAAYFAAALVDGVRQFRNRETDGCLTR